MAEVEVCIEPKMGATYGPSFEGEVAVYEYGTYTSGVLEGRRSRAFLDSGTLEEMRAKYPHAVVCESSGYVEDSFNDLPDEDESQWDDYDDCSRDWLLDDVN